MREALQFLCLLAVAVMVALVIILDLPLPKIVLPPAPKPPLYVLERPTEGGPEGNYIMQIRSTDYIDMSNTLNEGFGVYSDYGLAGCILDISKSITSDNRKEWADCNGYIVIEQPPATQFIKKP